MSADPAGKGRRNAGIVCVVASAVAFGAMAILARFAFASGVDTPTLLALRFSIAVRRDARAAARSRPPASARIDAGGARRPRRGWVTAGRRSAISRRCSSRPPGLAALLLYLHPALVAVLAAAFLHERLTVAKLVGARASRLPARRSTVAPAIGGDAAGRESGDPHGTGVRRRVGDLLRRVHRRCGLRSDGVPTALADERGRDRERRGACSSSPRWCAARNGRRRRGLAGSVAAHRAAVAPSFAITLYFAGLERIGPVRASTLSTVEPLCAVVLAALVLDESIAPVQLAGGMLILAAAVLIARARAAVGDDAGTSLRRAARPLRRAHAPEPRRAVRATGLRCRRSRSKHDRRRRPASPKRASRRRRATPTAGPRTASSSVSSATSAGGSLRLAVTRIMQGSASWNMPSAASQARSCAVAWKGSANGSVTRAEKRAPEQDRRREIDSPSPLAQRDDVDRSGDRNARMRSASRTTPGPSPEANIHAMPPTAAAMASHVWAGRRNAQDPPGQDRGEHGIEAVDDERVGDGRPRRRASMKDVNIVQNMSPETYPGSAGGAHGGPCFAAPDPDENPGHRDGGEQAPPECGLDALRALEEPRHDAGRAPENAGGHHQHGGAGVGDRAGVAHDRCDECRRVRWQPTAARRGRRRAKKPARVAAPASVQPMPQFT